MILPPAAELVALIRGVDDASSRAVAGLGGGNAASRLGTELAHLQSALNAADALAVGSAMTSARAALDDFLASSEFNAAVSPDASVIDIALLYTESSIQRPCAKVQPAAVVSSFASCTGR